MVFAINTSSHASQLFEFENKRVCIEKYLYTFLYAKFYLVVFELLPLLCTFENATKCIRVPFNLGSILVLFYVESAF